MSTFFLKPKYAPINVRGTDIQAKEPRWQPGPEKMAAEEPSPHRIKVRMKEEVLKHSMKDTTGASG